MLNCRNVYAHEHVHEFGEVKHAVAAAYATHFAVCSNFVGLDAGMPYGEGHGLLHVRAYLHRSGMVGHQGYAYRLVPLGHLVKYRADHTAVEVFDGAELQLQVAVVSGLVACLDVYEYEVVIAQGVYSGLGFPLVIGVSKSGSAWHDDVVQSCVMADATYQVDS